MRPGGGQSSARLTPRRPLSLGGLAPLEGQRGARPVHTLGFTGRETEAGRAGSWSPARGDSAAAPGLGFSLPSPGCLPVP